MIKSIYWLKNLIINNKKQALKFLFVIILLQIYMHSDTDLFIKDIRNSGDKSYFETNIRIYKGSPAWQLAKAIYFNDTWKIRREIRNNPELLNYESPVYGLSPLSLATLNKRKGSVETLLKLGADVNKGSVPGGRTALYFACDSIYHKYNPDFEIIKLLIKYGVDVNKGTDEQIYNDYFGIKGMTPLMHAASDNLELTKLLVDSGANINQQAADGETAVYNALAQKKLLISHYLIVEKKADLSLYKINELGQEIRLVSQMKSQIYDLDSSAYKMKKEMIDEFIRQGIDYYNIYPSEHQLKTIKSRYPNTWEEYIKVY